MQHIEQRMAIVEAKMAEHSDIVEELREGQRQFEQRVDRRFEQIDDRFGQVEARLTALDQKIDAGLAALNQRLDVGLAAVNARIDVQSAEIATLRRDITMQMSTQFRWTAGMMLSGFSAMVAAVLAG